MMNEKAEGATGPVSPQTVGVGDLGEVCAALGIAAPPAGASAIEVEVLPGRVVTVTEAPGPANPFVYVCTTNLTDARAQFESVFGHAESGPDTVDPVTLRLRGCLARAAELVIDAVHCSRAEQFGVPCSADCSPSLSFE